MLRLTKKHEKQFWGRVTDWIARFRVIDWTIHKKTNDRDEGDSESLADCTSQVEFKTAIITLHREWPIKPTAKALDEIACHEVLHVVLAPLMALAEDRFVTQQQLDDAEHEIIRVVLSAFFKKGTTSD
jgi:hypothetical protein